jgi:hypothetical protein
VVDRVDPSPQSLNKGKNEMEKTFTQEQLNKIVAREVAKAERRGEANAADLAKQLAALCNPPNTVQARTVRAREALVEATAALERAVRILDGDE